MKPIGAYEFVAQNGGFFFDMIDTNPIPADLPTQPVWQQFPSTAFTQTIMGWINQYPFVGILVLLIFLDILMGILVAVAGKKLSSALSFRGMNKKAGILIIVGAAAAVQSLAGLPLAKLVAIFYIVTEVISIMEAGAALGLPLPKVLVDAMTKLRTDNTAVLPVIVPVPPPSQTIIAKGAVYVRQAAGTTQQIQLPPDPASTAAIQDNTDATRANTAARVAANPPATPPV